MRVLLDTNVLLWLLAQPDRVAADARATLARAEVVLYLSPASAWEVAIKVALGKLDLGEADPRTWWQRALQALDARPLPVQPEHGLATAALPPHHRDPFDRLLVAQALEGSLTLATADAAMLGRAGAENGTASAPARPRSPPGARADPAVSRSQTASGKPSTSR